MRLLAALGAALVCAASSAVSAPEAEAPPAEAATATASSPSTMPASAPAGAASASAPADGLLAWKDLPLLKDTDGPAPPSQLLASVLIVLALGAGAVLMARKLIGRLKAQSGKKISVLESACLGPHKLIHLVKVGSQTLLLGNSRDRISLLADVSLALDDNMGGSTGVPPVSASHGRDARATCSGGSPGGFGPVLASRVNRDDPEGGSR